MDCLVGRLNLKAVDRSSIDGEKLRQGIPCIRQVFWFFPDDPWEKIALALIPAMREDFPALGDDLLNVEKQIESGKVRLFDAFTDFPGSVETAVDRWSNEAHVKP